MSLLSIYFIEKKLRLSQQNNTVIFQYKMFITIIVLWK